MQLSGSFLQSVLHLNLSQASQPIGGVLASPFSRQCVFFERKVVKTTTTAIHDCDISLPETVRYWRYPSLQKERVVVKYSARKKL